MLSSAVMILFEISPWIKPAPRVTCFLGFNPRRKLEFIVSLHDMQVIFGSHEEWHAYSRPEDADDHCLLGVAEWRTLSYIACVPSLRATGRPSWFRHLDGVSHAAVASDGGL